MGELLVQKFMPSVKQSTFTLESFVRGTVGESDWNQHIDLSQLKRDLQLRKDKWIGFKVPMKEAFNLRVDLGQQGAVYMALEVDNPGFDSTWKAVLTDPSHLAVLFDVKRVVVECIKELNRCKIDGLIVTAENVRSAVRVLVKRDLRNMPGTSLLRLSSF